MEGERYSFEQAQQEAELIKKKADEVKEGIKDESLNTEHYIAAERFVDECHKKFFNLDNVSAYIELQQQAKDAGLGDLVQTILYKNFQNVQDGVLNDMLRDLSSEDVDLRDKVIANIAGISAKILLEGVDHKDRNQAQEVADSLEEFLISFFNASLKAPQQEAEQPTETEEVALGMPLHNMDWPGQGQLTFEDVGTIRRNGKSIKISKAYLKIYSRENKQPQWIDLSDYLSNEGKTVNFTGIDSAKSRRKVRGVAFEHGNGQHVVGIDQEYLKDSFFDTCYSILHEIGHIDIYGEDIDALIRGISDLDDRFGDEEYAAAEFAAIRQKMDVEIDNLTRRKAELEKAAGISSLPSLAMEYNRVVSRLYILDRSRKIFENPSTLTAEDRNNLSQYPELGKLMDVYGERRACKFAMRELKRLDPSIYDYESRSLTASKLYMKQRSRTDQDDRFSQNFEGFDYLHKQQ